jgi:hypothetical protein
MCASAIGEGLREWAAAAIAFARQGGQAQAGITGVGRSLGKKKPSKTKPGDEALDEALEQAEIERLLGGAPRLAREDVVKHPRLPEARKVYLAHFLSLYGGDRFVVRLLIEAGRFLVYHVALHLDAVQEPAQREI